jgi:hypothetical protein
MKRASYKEGIMWIALNDEPTENNMQNVETVSEQISTLLLADLFERDPLDVATDIINFRNKK